MNCGMGATADSRDRDPNRTRMLEPGRQRWFLTPPDPLLCCRRSPSPAFALPRVNVEVQQQLSAPAQLAPPALPHSRECYRPLRYGDMVMHRERPPQRCALLRPFLPGAPARGEGK